MAKVEGKGKTNFQPDPDADVQITFEDQKRINQFANLVARTDDLKEELKVKKNDLTNIEEAIEEIELADDSEPIQFLIGEVFVFNNLEKTQSLLQETKEKRQQEIKDIEAKIADIQGTMNKLKSELYGKFGQKNIYLENDEEE